MPEESSAAQEYHAQAADLEIAALCSSCGVPAVKAESKFCHLCGARLPALLGDALDEMFTRVQDVYIEGFNFKGGVFCETPVFEVMWDTLRSSISENFVKVEPASSSDESPSDPHAIVQVDPNRICYTQATCSRHFKNGRPVTTLVDELRQKLVDPLVHPDLVLSVAKAWIRRPDLKKPGCKHTPRRECLFTMDHRRLYAMKAAGCRKVCARIRLQGRGFDEFVNKSGIEQRKHIELR